MDLAQLETEINAAWEVLKKEHKNLTKLGIQKDIQLIQGDIKNYKSIYQSIETDHKCWLAQQLNNKLQI